jgi:hypothetical protein
MIQQRPSPATDHWTQTLWYNTTAPKHYMAGYHWIQTLWAAQGGQTLWYNTTAPKHYMAGYHWIQTLWAAQGGQGSLQHALSHWYLHNTRTIPPWYPHDTTMIPAWYWGAPLVKWTRMQRCKPVWAPCGVGNLASDEVQWPGRYGSQASIRQGHIRWHVAVVLPGSVRAVLHRGGGFVRVQRPHGCTSAFSIWRGGLAVQRCWKGVALVQRSGRGTGERFHATRPRVPLPEYQRSPPSPAAGVLQCPRSRCHILLVLQVLYIHTHVLPRKALSPCTARHAFHVTFSLQHGLVGHPRSAGHPVLAPSQIWYYLKTLLKSESSDCNISHFGFSYWTRTTQRKAASCNSTFAFKKNLFALKKKQPYLGVSCFGRRG